MTKSALRLQVKKNKKQLFLKLLELNNLQATDRFVCPGIEN